MAAAQFQGVFVISAVMLGLAGFPLYLMPGLQSVGPRDRYIEGGAVDV